MTKKQKLKTLLYELLENVEEAKDCIIFDFVEEEREVEDIKQYLEALERLERVVDYYS